MSEVKSISERIRDYQTEILRGDLSPQRGAEILMEMSSLLGNINEKITETTMKYNQVLLGFLDSEKKANRAKIKAEISQEYQDMMRARNIEKLTTEMIRSIKHFIRIKENEWREGKNL